MGEALGRLTAALQGIYQCCSIRGIHRCLLTRDHEGRHIWSNGPETVTWAPGSDREEPTP